MTDLMLRTALVLFLITLLRPTGISQVDIGVIPSQHFPPSSYQAGNQNIDFAQNRDMSLFVANNLGVLSYNGNSWQKHAIGTGEKKRSLAFDDKSNRLYVGSQGEFGYFSNQWEYESLYELIPDDRRDFDEVWDVYIIKGRTYFCTFQGIYIYDGRSIEVIGYDLGLNRSFAVNDRLYTQKQNGRLLELVEGELTESFIQREEDQIISGVINDGDGLLLFYNSGQIELSTPYESQIKYSDLSKVLKGAYVNHVLQLSDNRLAISTQTSGLYLFDPHNGTTLNVTNEYALATNACLRSFQDYSGNLWVGLQNGIALIDINSPMRFINRHINLQGSGYEAIETDEGYYYTTSNGIYYALHTDGECQFISGTAGPAYGLQEILGNVYAGHHTGLFLLKNGRASRIAECDGLWRIQQLKSNPKYLVGGSYSGLYLFVKDKNGSIRLSHKINGFDESSRFFEEDDFGNIWVGQYYKGLYQLKFSDDYTQVTAIDIGEGDSIDSYEQIILSEVNNELHIASKNGLAKIDEANQEIINSELFSKYLEYQEVYLFEEDRQKNVHVVAEDMVGVFKQISTKNYVFVPSSLRQMRYNLNNDLLNISTDIKNGVLYSSNDGFIFYDPKLESNTTANQPIVITRLYSVLRDTALMKINPFDPVLREQPNVDVSYEHKLLRFDVESYEFTIGEDQEFRYQLKGFEDDYTDWTNIATKEYSNLKEGTYEFSVQSRNHLGVINTSELLRLEVYPPFYRGTVAKIVYVGLLALVFYLIFIFQKLRYQKKADQIVKSKEQELLDLEQKKVLELTLLQEEKVDNELRHVNNLLAASTMNLVVKNEFINSIKGKLNDTKLLGANQQTKKALDRIVKGIDSTLRLQEDWKQFKLHFDKVHGNFLKRLQDVYVDLSPNEQKLCVLLRLNLNTKEISNLMSISLRGVEVARYRLRKKLKLQKGQNLSKFILEF